MKRTLKRCSADARQWYKGERWAPGSLSSAHSSWRAGRSAFSAGAVGRFVSLQVDAPAPPRRAQQGRSVPAGDPIAGGLPRSRRLTPDECTIKILSYKLTSASNSAYEGGFNPGKAGGGVRGIRKSARMSRAAHGFFRYFSLALCVLIGGTMAGTVLGAIRYTSGLIVCSFMGILYCLYGLIWGPHGTDRS